MAALPRKIIVILGPTASGKSGLGVRLAKKFHGVIISADSRQVYRGLNIGTGKITKKEMRGVPHYLLDVVSPKSQYSVAHYVRDVQRVIKKLNLETPIFLVGGSPFYIKAVTTPLAFSPVPPNAALRRRLSLLTTTNLMKLLRKKDPLRAKNIDPHNKRRIIRAIEIASYVHPPARGGSTAFSARRRNYAGGVVGARILKIGLKLPRVQLYRKIDHRVDQWIHQGIIQEVRRLKKQGLSWKRISNFGLEYAIIAQYLQGQLDTTTMIARQKFSIHDFARRQLTWWRREKDIYWITSSKQAINHVKKFLEQPRIQNPRTKKLQ